MTRKQYKRCHWCGKVVYPGTGTYYYGKLHHKWCVNLRKGLSALGKRR